MTLRLPPSDLPIPDAWGPEEEGRWHDLAASARTLRSSAEGLVHAEYTDALRALLDRGDEAGVVSLLPTRGYARALAWLWSEVDGGYRDTVSLGLVESLSLAQPTPSALLVQQLQQVYFMRFDDLDRLDEPGTYGSTLNALARYLDTTTKDLDGQPPLYGREAPAELARWVRDRKADPEESFAALGLTGHDGGRFMELVRQHLYLVDLQALPFGANGDALAAVTYPAVSRKPHLRGKLLGHAALEILIDRAENQYPGEIWREAVLAIAGDPRLTYEDAYREWWPVLGKAREQRVISWLARVDLQVFLDALEEFSKDGAHSDMERMLPPRKRLLEGLIDLGLVRRSRLFLGDAVRGHVLRGPHSAKLSASAQLTGTQYRPRALLYLDCGDFHLIEGSHNTQLWIYLDRPSSRVVDPSRRRFAYEELTSELANSFERDWETLMGTTQGRGWTSVRHAALWQSRFLDFLAKHGVRVDPEAILTTGDYRRLRDRTGIPWVNPNGRPVPLNKEAGSGTT